MQPIVFKFIRISVDGEIIENDTKTIVWTENILFVFGAKTPFSNLSGLVWTGPLLHQFYSVSRDKCGKLEVVGTRPF